MGNTALEMKHITPGQTQTHVFTFSMPEDQTIALRDAVASYRQGDRVVLNLTNCFENRGEGNKYELWFTISEEQSLQFLNQIPCTAQLNILLSDGSRFASRLIPIVVGEQLYRNVISTGGDGL